MTSAAYSRRTEFLRHSSASYPGVHARLFDGLGSDPRDVAATVQNLLLHPVLAGARGVAMPNGAADDCQARSVRRLLDRAMARDGRPLNQARAAADRFYGTCRDHALLACSLFRHHRVPARLRVGFADYFTAGFL
ncbi:MAG: transglutaminase domain-containing protein, partial [Dongiaceae bacterium]